MNINWFPGHMKKTEGLIKDNLKLVDIVIELVDARIPLASKNPLIDEITKGKPRLKYRFSVRGRNHTRRIIPR